MSLREIPKGEWPQFLDAFTRGHRAWLATIDSPDTMHGTRGRERPLQSVAPTGRAPGEMTIEIRFMLDSQEPPAILIDAPVRLRVDETDEGTTQGLEILDAAGHSTRLRFRTAPRMEMLDGVAPGELSSG